MEQVDILQLIVSQAGIEHGQRHPLPVGRDPVGGVVTGLPDRLNFLSVAVTITSREFVPVFPPWYAIMPLKELEKTPLQGSSSY